jgi:hypothetical protein
MGCSAGPKNTTVFNNSKFYFDASMPWAAIGSTTFLNPKFLAGSYSHYTIDTTVSVIAGTGVSKYLDLQSLQQFKTAITGSGTFNQVQSYTWVAVVGNGSTSQSNTFFKCDDSTGVFSITSNGNFLHEHAGTSHSSTNLSLITTGWKHLVLVRNGTSCTLYVDTISSFTYTLVNNFGTADASYRMGTFPGSLVDVAYLNWMPGYTMGLSDIQYNYRLLKNRFNLS